MEIRYKSKRLEKQLTNAKETKRTFGTMAQKVKQRIVEIKSSDNLDILKKIPAANCHELTGDMYGFFAVDVSANYRLIFEPDNDPIPYKEHVGIDCTKITIVMIHKIEDYH